MMIRWRFLLMLCGIFLWGCSASQAMSRIPMVRSSYPVKVAIIQGAASFELTIRGNFDIYTSDKKRLYSGRRLRKARVTPGVSGIKIEDLDFHEDKIKIMPERVASLYVNNRRFRGSLDVIRKSSESLLAVNTVDLEDYICGVLYHEVSPRWPMESLKAQAVAARTYALYRASKNKKRPYDLTNDIYSQVYGGRTSEKYRTNLAVEATAGMVLAYDGELFPSYFHADSGGHTEDVSELWDEDWPPLQGVRDPFSRQSPHYNWKRNFRSKDIQDKLNEAGYDIWLIESIEVTERNPSGRIRRLKITDRKGKSVEISGKDFRHLVGPNIVRSNKYDVLMQGYYFDLIGQGWGHGVGMSQWGANFMARDRKSFREILRFYYPGTRIVHYETLGF